MKKYFISAACDPYNARFHYNGQKVTRYNGATPVEWVLDDNFGEGYTIEEARAELLRLALDGNDAVYFNDEDAAGESWYKGAGVYDDSRRLVYEEGVDDYFRADTMTYSIEEL